MLASKFKVNLKNSLNEIKKKTDSSNKMLDFLEVNTK